MADMGAQKTAKDTVTTIMMDFTSVESDYNTCISAAGATLKKSMEAFTAAFDLCVPPASS